VFNDAASNLREFPLARLSPANDRPIVGGVVCLQQGEILAVVAFAVEQAKELREDPAGGVPLDETVNRPHVASVFGTRIECALGVERGGPALRFRVVDAR
jgi:hypothetical protein